MANTTVAGAKAIHGQNPQFLVETVIRNRIYESSYWKEHCFALTGVYGNQRPTEYICLLLQRRPAKSEPEKEILVEYLRADEFKYLRALAALYIRMTFDAVEVYELLEPLMKDYRKLRVRSMAGYSLTFIDEFVYSLLTEERKMARLDHERVVCWMQWKIEVTQGPTGAGVEAEVHLAHRVARRIDQVGVSAGAGATARVPEVQTQAQVVAFRGRLDLGAGHGPGQALGRGMCLEVPLGLVHLLVHHHAEAYRLIGWIPSLIKLGREIYTVEEGWKAGRVLRTRLRFERNNLLLPPYTKLVRERFPPLFHPREVAKLLKQLRTHETAIPVETIPN
ncbi:hypothetical protein NMY22_g18960 [Coprinellus aureogranulatus]|nr:hypothetical protein NMY22_g18960 [Coprinellus aureogranulatus]